MSPANKIIQDAYEILEDIGRGGMARVYKARQLSLGRVVAIKEIKPAFAKNPELVLRFKREARTAANLVHENIVQVYNFGEPGRDTFFIVMEYVEGHDLKSLLKQAGTIPPRIAAVIVREVARALAYAHARGLVHRDVKPGNIMISKLGEVKLMDFGIVREMDSDLTRTGAFLGTPNYMAPEQFLGDEITRATDIFSLGVVLYELLTGQKPFKGDGDGTLAKKVRTEKEAKVRAINSAVPRKLQKIAHQCLMKKTEQRPGDAYELIRSLDRFLGRVPREEQIEELADWVRRVSGEDRTMTLDQPAPAVEAEAEKIPAREPASGQAIKMASLREQEEPLKEPAQPAKTTRAKPEKAPPPQDEESEDLDASNPADLGDAIVKWIWRVILLVVALLAAVAVFYFY